jgi:hypothetical protein
VVRVGLLQCVAVANIVREWQGLPEDQAVEPFRRQNHECDSSIVDLLVQVFELVLSCKEGGVDIDRRSGIDRLVRAPLVPASQHHPSFVQESLGGQH